MQPSGWRTSGFRLAERRKARGRGEGRVTCVDKANVFAAFAFMRKIFYERCKPLPRHEGGSLVR
jgi:isocitrate/isopropylmalate dehydrogenase